VSNGKLAGGVALVAAAVLSIGAVATGHLGFSDTAAPAPPTTTTSPAAVATTTASTAPAAAPSNTPAAPSCGADVSNPLHYYTYDITGIAFGPQVDGEVQAVLAELHVRRLHDSALTMAHAVYYGILPVPVDDAAWVSSVQSLEADHCKWEGLVGQLEAKEATGSPTLEGDSSQYDTYWFLHTPDNGTPLLRQGPGHAPEAGAVLTFRFPDGTMFKLRRVCGFQPADDHPFLGIPVIQEASQHSSAPAATPAPAPTAAPTTAPPATAAPTTAPPATTVPHTSSSKPPTPPNCLHNPGAAGCPTNPNSGQDTHTTNGPTPGASTPPASSPVAPATPGPAPAPVAGGSSSGSGSGSATPSGSDNGTSGANATGPAQDPNQGGTSSAPVSSPFGG
jgi:hypothetical protein